LKTVAVIPARLGSTRLQSKALAEISGRPMIARVVERVRAARGLDAVWVATDHRSIAEVAEAAGARVAMTSPDCPSGTDRIAEAARSIDADLFLNIQGDEPLLPPAAVEALHARLVSAVAQGIEMATLARPLEAAEEALPQVVKVVLAEDSTALYFSRSLIPFPREKNVVAPLAHIGLYGYTRGALARFAALQPTALERAEGLEQLRPLAHGWKIAVAVGPWKTQAVDTAEDLAQVRAKFATLLNPSAASPGA
jgi:3-deoxy-manno-octulosonate cytidylyltransferase (CMP-KDO synthetase)